MPRSYIVDLPGGTATTSVQLAGAGSLKEVLISIHNAAVGKLEISLAPTSQIGTAQPTKDVLARVNNSATAGDLAVVIPVPTTKFKVLDLIYFHQTGAGNLGSASFSV